MRARPACRATSLSRWIDDTIVQVSDHLVRTAAPQDWFPPKAPATLHCYDFESLKHEADKRMNIPTAEYQSVLAQNTQRPVELRYPRNTDSSEI